jgi:hypothetical protein
MKGIRHRRRANVVVEALKAHRIRQKKERLIAGGGSRAADGIRSGSPV